MATFKEIRGQLIKKYTTNPTNPLEGQMWYNNTTGTLKVYRNIGGVWASGTSASNSPKTFAGGDGPVTAAWVAGGGGSPGDANATTEEYDGSSWTGGGAYPTATYGLAGVGPQTAALAFGGNSGSITAAASEYNGTAWSSPTSMPAARNYVCRAGTQTAALAFGGSNPAPTSQPETFEYDGSTWAVGGAYPTGIEYSVGTGTQTAALAATGYHQPGAPDIPNATNEYNGTAWTAGNVVNTARFNTQGFGIQTDAVMAGGNDASPPGASTATETYDGTDWSTSTATLGTARNGATAMGHNGGGTTAGWLVGGEPTKLATEEYTNPTISIQTVTTS